MPPELTAEQPNYYVDPQTGAEADENSAAVLDALLDKQEPKKPTQEKPLKTPTEEIVEGDEEETVEEEPANGESEEEAEEETEEEASEEDTDDDDDNIDNYKVSVTVDGVEKEVTLKELKASYSGNEYIAQNVQKAVEARKVLEHQNALLFETNNKQIEKLKSLDAILEAVAKPKIDWEELRVKNPQEYLIKREEQRDLQARQELVRKEIEKTENEQAEIQSQARQRFILDQGQLLATKLPILKDPQKAPAVMGELRNAAKNFGFTDQEVAGVLDHRQMLVLHAASEWLKELDRRSKVSKKVDKDEPSIKKVLIRPGTTKRSSGDANKKLTAQRLQQARSSGSADDVAATLLVTGQKPQTPILRTTRK